MTKALSILGVLALMAAPASATVYLNEVLGSTSGTDAEFIELYNSGPSAVNIGGWSIELWDSDAGSPYGGADATSPYAVPGGTTLAAGDYYLMANSTYGSFYPIAVRDYVLPENAIENSSYTIILANSASAIVDSVFVTDGGASDSANRAGAAFAPGATFGPDGSFLPGGFYRYGDGGSTLSLLEFNQPSGSATPGAANLPEPATLVLLAMGGALIVRRSR